MVRDHDLREIFQFVVSDDVGVITCRRGLLGVAVLEFLQPIAELGEGRVHIGRYGHRHGLVLECEAQAGKESAFDTTPQGGNVRDFLGR